MAQLHVPAKSSFSPSIAPIHPSFPSRWLLSASLLVFALSFLAPVPSSSALPASATSDCQFPAIFNFGDSSSDTGGIHATFPFMTLAEELPYGETFFHKPVNRYSDGRLLIDFIAQGLGKPFLSPYLQSVDSNFTHGANFASSGATARNTRSFISPFNLQIQVNQYKVFKDQVALTLEQKGPQPYLPQSVEYFVKGLHILQIGASDFSHAYVNLKMDTEQIKSYLPGVVNSISNAVKELYETGARTFWVMDVGPQGCLPLMLSRVTEEAALDEHGCARAYNDAVLFYNRLLKAQLALMADQYPDASLVYVDTFSILYSMVQNAPRYGFQYTTRACCGVGGRHNYDAGVQCGTSNHVHGQYLTALSCVNPGAYLNWDGVHLTDRANRLLARHILSAAFFHPVFPLAQLCPANLHSV